jgi:metal-responsive CopG/Arc/MetJ family transcriptional regulator
MSPHGGRRSGAGRKLLPPEEKSVRVQIVFAPDLLEKVDAAATAAKKSRSQFVTDIIRAALETPEDSICKK